MALADDTLSKIQPGWDAPPPAPPASPAKAVAQAKVGPTSKWARFAQVGEAKVRSFNIGKAAAATGRFFFGNTSKFTNQAIQEGRQILPTARMEVASLTKNPIAFRNASRASQQAYGGFNKNKGGILNTGTLTSEQEAKQGALKTGLKRIGGGTLGTAAEIGPFGELGKAGKVYKLGKGLVDVGEKSLGKSILEQALVGAGSGAAASAGQQLVDRGKVNLGQTLKSTAAGAIIGAGGEAGAKLGKQFLIKSGKMLFNRAADEAAPAAERLSKEIPVTDTSEAVKGKITKELPPARTPPTVRPSSKGYTDTEFRLQFKHASTEVAKHPAIAEAFIRTGSKDPLTLTVDALAHSKNSKFVNSAVDKLLPDLNSGERAKVAKKLISADSHSAVSDVLWDAAKNNETRSQGTPMVTKIGFGDNKATEVKTAEPSKPPEKSIEDHIATTGKTPDITVGDAKLHDTSSQSGAIAPGQAVKDVHDMIEKNKATTKYSGDIQRGGYMVEGAKKQIAGDALKLAKSTPKISTEDKKLIQDYRDSKEAGTPTKELPARLQKTNDDITALNKAALDAQKETAKLEGREFTSNVNPETYTHRVAQEKGGIFDKIVQGTKRTVGGGRSFARSTSSGKNRVFQAITDEAGNRRVVAIKNESFGRVKGLTAFDTKEGKMIGKFKYDPKTGNLTNAKGDTFKLGQATTDEITKATGQKYYVDPYLTSIKNYVESRTALENVRFIQSIKDHPDFKNFASGPGENTPKGWEPVHGLFQFMGYKFEPKVAEALRDIVKVSSDETSVFDKLGNFLKKTIVYFPLKHELNQLATYAVDRGLSSYVNPAAYKRGAVSIVKAFHEVTNRGPIFQKLQKAGFSLPSADEKAFTNYVTNELKNLTKDDPAIAHVAKLFGTNPLRVYDALQHTAVWQFGDILNVARVLERMAPKTFSKGASFEDAMKQTEKYSLQYRVPTRIGGGKIGREASRLISSPKIFFGRYKYDLYKIMGNAIKDSTDLKSLIKTPGKNLQAIDKLAAMAIGAGVVWPLVDKGVQKLTGNKNANIKAPGALELPETLNQVRTGKKGVGTAISNQLYISSATTIPLDLKNNRDSFTGKVIYDPNASGSDQWKQIGQWVVSQIAPGKNLTNAQANAKGATAVDKFLSIAKNFALSTAGVNTPKNSPEMTKLNSLQYDSLPLVQTNAKALAKKGDFGGAQNMIDNYDKQVLEASKAALRAAGMPIPSDNQLVRSLKKSGIYYAPKRATIIGWQTKKAANTKNVLGL